MSYTYNPVSGTVGEVAYNPLEGSRDAAPESDQSNVPSNATGTGTPGVTTIKKTGGLPTKRQPVDWRAFYANMYARMRGAWDFGRNKNATWETNPEYVLGGWANSMFNANWGNTDYATNPNRYVPFGGDPKYYVPETGDPRYAPLGGGGDDRYAYPAGGDPRYTPLGRSKYNPLSSHVGVSPKLSEEAMNIIRNDMMRRKDLAFRDYFGWDGVYGPELDTSASGSNYWDFWGTGSGGGGGWGYGGGGWGGGGGGSYSNWYKQLVNWRI